MPDQDPAAIVAAVRDHLAAGGFGDIELIREESEPAYWTESDDPMLDAAARASEAVFGATSVRYVSMPGVAPMWQVCGRDAIPMTSLGAGEWDCRAHAPDENIRLDAAANAVRVTARFLDEFAALG